MSEKIKFDSTNYKSFFRSSEFSKLTSDERRDLISFSVEQTRLKQGLSPIKVVFGEDDEACRGYCSPIVARDGTLRGHELWLNEDVLTTKNPYASYSVYNTYHHELEHASQYENASNPEISNSNAATLEQRLNDEHYYCADGDKLVRPFFGEPHRKARFSEQTDYQLYRAQACEADARAAGLNSLRELQSDLKNDEMLNRYVKRTESLEISQNREMLSELGMHSRENMAREELSHLPSGKVSVEDQERVIAYAREKDFETYKTVAEVDAWGDITEEKMRQQFDNNEQYEDFYQSDVYLKNKVKSFEKKDYKFSQYKWDESQDPNERFLESHMHSSGSANESSDEYFLNSNAPKRVSTCETSDESFLDNAISTDEQKLGSGETTSKTNNVAQTI